MNKRKFLIIGIPLLVFGGLIGFNLIKKIMMQHFFATYKPPAVTVSSATATVKAWRPKLHAVGNFSAVSGVNVAAEVSGTITAIHFKSGQPVAAHDPLIDIDDSVEQATLKFNQADLALQQMNYQRQLDLLKTHATAQVNVDEAHARFLQAQATLEKTQALIGQKHIKAPFGGLLGLRGVNLGEYVTPGQTHIVNLQALDTLFLEFYVPEQHLKALQVGQSVSAALSPYPELMFAGKISAIHSEIDANTHNIKVQATFNNCTLDAIEHLQDASKVTTAVYSDTQTLVSCHPHAATQNAAYAFIPGLFASVEIDLPATSKVLVLPTTAISYSANGDCVFVIEPDAAIQTKPQTPPSLLVKQVFVTTGEQLGNETIITKGIQPGQRVVGTGELKLQNGTPVIINDTMPLKTRGTHLGE